MLSTLYSGHIFFHLQVTLENLIDEQPELAQNDQGRVAWEGDALNKVLGKEKTWPSARNGITSCS